ncbi:hypothetical protein LINGRAHAP2_LOCUS12574, partial [Linum grandiflorum]
NPGVLTIHRSKGGIGWLSTTSTPSKVSSNHLSETTSSGLRPSSSRIEAANPNKFLL